MHHRRKQRFSEGAYQEHVIDNEESTLERTINIGPENRSDNENPSILISDSEDVDLQEESILSKKRRRPPTSRKPFPLKRKIAHMTEEEQLAMAVKISQQEQTNQETYTQEEEDELIKKAIEESLHICHVPDSPIRAAKEESTIETPSRKVHSSVNNHEEEPHSSKVSILSGGDSTRTPFVVLQRLSQDIVESSSVILSPNCKDPLSCIENGLQFPPSPCTSSDFVKMSPVKGGVLSPVFPKRSPCPRRLVPCRLFPERSPSVDPLGDLDDQCTHCSESPPMGSSSVLPTSQGESIYQNDWVSTKNVNTDKAKEIDCEGTSSVEESETSDCKSNKRNQSEIHYYWGVPFCPKGLDPSEYTKVILCQLEVYQKSLKSAQRQLLHKMDYGQPIHLAASSQEEYTQGNLSHEDTEDGTAEDDTQKTEEGEKGGDNSDSEEAQHKSKKLKTSQSPVQSVQEDDHGSSSQEDKDERKTPFTKLLPSECPDVAPVAPGESAVTPTAVRNDRHLMEHTEIAQEEEITICPETQPSPARQEESDKEDHSDEMEIAPESQACISSEPFDEDVICLDKTFSKNVACPMCGCDFPRNQIERHAAYCDGTNGQQEMAALRPRNKLMRQRHERSADSIPSADSGKSEKCYLCKSQVPLIEYNTHVDNCLRTAMLATPGSHRPRSPKQEYPGHNGRLLSMLEQSESSLAANRNSPEPCDLSPSREEDGESFSSERLNLSDSPIRSFVSISEATDCLVDFKKQFSRQLNSRRATRRGRRRRM